MPRLYFISPIFSFFSVLRPAAKAKISLTYGTDWLVICHKSSTTFVVLWLLLLFYFAFLFFKTGFLYVIPAILELFVDQAGLKKATNIVVEQRGACWHLMLHILCYSSLFFWQQHYKTGLKCDDSHILLQKILKVFLRKDYLLVKETWKNYYF